MLCIRETKSGFVSLHGKEDKKTKQPPKNTQTAPVLSDKPCSIAYAHISLFLKEKKCLINSYTTFNKCFMYQQWKAPF